MERAFIITPGSEIYENHFQSKRAKAEFWEAGDAFFDKLGWPSTEYQMSKQLCCSLTPEAREELKGQLHKYQTDDGLHSFRKASKMQKAWETDVATDKRLNECNANMFWFNRFSNAYRGQGKIFDFNGTLYAYASSNSFRENIEFATKIPLSEYYHAFAQATAAQEGRAKEA